LATASRVWYWQVYREAEKNKSSYFISTPRVHKVNRMFIMFFLKLELTSYITKAPIEK
jgi:hypothetical protein